MSLHVICIFTLDVFQEILHITSNSVEFHEKGKRHQENVAKKLKYITKKSRNDEKESLKVDAAIQQMEAAALEAYRKDVENNADLTAVNITKKLQETNSVLGDNGAKIWHEAKSKEGNVYYWNTITNETSWEPPEQGFLSIADQRVETDEKTKAQLKEVEKQRQTEGRLRMEQIKQEEAEEKARAFREKMKKRRVVDDTPPSIPGPIIPPGNVEPYGQWKVIQERPNIDLQLPKQEYLDVPVLEEEPPPLREFKEKTIDSLGEGGSATFKKRKFGAGAKRNVRQRLDDD